jgi:hypothetical protein
MMASISNNTRIACTLLNNGISFRTPKGLEDVSKYPQLIEYLASQGDWSDEDLIKLIGGNILRVLEENEQVIKTFTLIFTHLFVYFSLLVVFCMI